MGACGGRAGRAATCSSTVSGPCTTRGFCVGRGAGGGGSSCFARGCGGGGQLLLRTRLRRRRGQLLLRTRLRRRRQLLLRTRLRRRRQLLLRTWLRGERLLLRMELCPLRRPRQRRDVLARTRRLALPRRQQCVLDGGQPLGRRASPRVRVGLGGSLRRQAAVRSIGARAWVVAIGHPCPRRRRTIAVPQMRPQVKPEATPIRSRYDGPT